MDLAHGVGEGLRDAPALSLPEGLAVAQVDHVAAGGLGGDQRAHQPRALGVGVGVELGLGVGVGVGLSLG